MSNLVPIAFFEDKYEISDEGRVWNKGKHSWQRESQNPNGYWKVLLSLNGVKKQYLLHQLVARHFLPNPYRYRQVNHIDGNKANNSLSNLEWISNSGNIQHSLEIGLRKGFMSLDDKYAYMEEVLSGAEVKDVAERIGRHPVVLSKMLRNAAITAGRLDEWTEIMKERRRNAAIRNLEKINN
jgi:hypothetical protein